jgi:hypothetical protein
MEAIKEASLERQIKMLSQNTNRELAIWIRRFIE